MKAEQYPKPMLSKSEVPWDKYMASEGWLQAEQAAQVPNLRAYKAETDQVDEARNADAVRHWANYNCQGNWLFKGYMDTLC